jgi:hypothetical protein
MLANCLQHQRRNKMDLIIFLSIVAVLVLAFISSQLAIILFLVKQNKELIQDLNDSSPPF